MRLPPELSARIADAVDTLDPNGTLPDSRGAALGALPLLADLGGCDFIRPDGEFLEVVWDQNEDQPTILRDVPVAALVVGTERFPWLRELVPSRPADAVTCIQCAGVGKIRVDNSLDVLCGPCKVLGWVAPASGKQDAEL